MSRWLNNHMGANPAHRGQRFKTRTLDCFPLFPSVLLFLQLFPNLELLLELLFQWPFSLGLLHLWWHCSILLSGPKRYCFGRAISSTSHGVTARQFRHILAGTTVSPEKGLESTQTRYTVYGAITSVLFADDFPRVVIPFSSVWAFWINKKVF